jgi:putative PIN family toxin of toxin-antitoxin system
VLRVVFDTNLFVSSLLVKEGLPAQALAAWRAGRFVLIISPVIVDEITTTLKYERIRRKYGVTDEDVAQLTLLLITDAQVVPGDTEEMKVAGGVPDDQDDEIILACAVDGRADLIVSGDSHLLSLTAYRNIPIVTVRQFINRLAQSGE